MPIVTIKLIEGRTEEQKKALVEKVTEAIVESVNVKPEAVAIVLEEMAKNHYATGGVRISDK